MNNDDMDEEELERNQDPSQSELSLHLQSSLDDGYFPSRVAVVTPVVFPPLCITAEPIVYTTKEANDVVKDSGLVDKL